MVALRSAGEMNTSQPPCSENQQHKKGGIIDPGTLGIYNETYLGSNAAFFVIQARTQKREA